MRDRDQKYYLCKSGEVKRRAEEHRKAYIKLKSKLWKVVESFGSDSASIDTQMMLIRGIAFKGDAPTGWTKEKHGVSRPKKGTLPAEVRRFFVPDGGYMVETHKDLVGFLQWLGCPFGYGWKSKEGASSGSSHIGRLFARDRMFWYDEHGPIMLELPDVAGAKARAAEAGHIVDDNVLDWTPPKGLKEIMKEEWDLMAARHERAEKGKS